MFELFETGGFIGEPGRWLGDRRRNARRSKRLFLKVADRVIPVEGLDRVAHRLVGDAEVVAFVHPPRRPAHDPLDHAGADSLFVHQGRDGAAECVRGRVNLDLGTVGECPDRASKGRRRDSLPAGSGKHMLVAGTGSLFVFAQDL